MYSVTYLKNTHQSILQNELNTEKIPPRHQLKTIPSKKCSSKNNAGTKGKKILKPFVQQKWQITPQFFPGKKKTVLLRSCNSSGGISNVGS